jgi:hypothetical protein
LEEESATQYVYFLEDAVVDPAFRWGFSAESREVCTGDFVNCDKGRAVLGEFELMEITREIIGS